jgi:glycosyltransferase involved in cell wall biosynthesis
MDLISIIIPCYNCEEYIVETVQSVLDSDYKNIEIILVNDGSKDKTANIIDTIAKKYGNISAFHIENNGPSKARNIAISKAKGEYILPLDGDDKIDANYISKAHHIISNSPQIKVVYCNAEYFGDKTGAWLLPDFSYKLLATNNMIFISAMFRKSDWEEIGGFDEKMIHGIEDWDFWISMLKNGGEVYKLDYTGFYYRITIHSRTIKLFQEGKIKLMYQYIFNKHKDFFIPYLTDPLNLIYQLEKANHELDKLKNKSFVKLYLYLSNLNKKIRKRS